MLACVCPAMPILHQLLLPPSEAVFKFGFGQCAHSPRRAFPRRRRCRCARRAGPSASAAGATRAAATPWRRARQVLRTCTRRPAPSTTMARAPRSIWILRRRCCSHRRRRRGAAQSTRAPTPRGTMRRTGFQTRTATADWTRGTCSGGPPWARRARACCRAHPRSRRTRPARCTCARRACRRGCAAPAASRARAPPAPTRLAHTRCGVAVRGHALACTTISAQPSALCMRTSLQPARPTAWPCAHVLHA